MNLCSPLWGVAESRETWQVTSPAPYTPPYTGPYGGMYARVRMASLTDGRAHSLQSVQTHGEREFLIGNLLVRIYLIIVMIRWTGLASWEFELAFPGSLTSEHMDVWRVDADRGVGGEAGKV